MAGTCTAQSSEGCPPGARAIWQGWPGTHVSERLPAGATEVCLVRPDGPPPLIVDSSRVSREEYVAYRKAAGHVVWFEVLATRGVLMEGGSWIGTELTGRLIRSFGGRAPATGLIAADRVVCEFSGGSLDMGGTRVTTARTSGRPPAVGDSVIAFALPDEHEWACGFMLTMNDGKVGLPFDDADGRRRWSGVTRKQLLTLLGR